MKNQAPENHRAIVVCTNKRAVLFGYVPSNGPSNEEIHAGKLFTLFRPRMCVYWSREIGGVLGLAVTGPDANCRISPAPTAITLGGNTEAPHDCVMDASDDAVAMWELAPWTK